MVEDFHIYDFLFRIFVTRNFFWEEYLKKDYTYLKHLILKKLKIEAERMGQIGIDIRDPSQAVGNSFTVLNKGKSLGTFQKKILVEKNC